MWKSLWASFYLALSSEATLHEQTDKYMHVFGGSTTVSVAQIEWCKNVHVSHMQTDSRYSSSVHSSMRMHTQQSDRQTMFWAMEMRCALPVPWLVSISVFSCRSSHSLACSCSVSSLSLSLFSFFWGSEGGASEVRKDKSGRGGGPPVSNIFSFGLRLSAPAKWFQHSSTLVLSGIINKW